MSRIRNAISRLSNFWFGPAPWIRLRAFEIVFTLTFLAYFFVARYSSWREWLTPEGYHYDIGSTPSYLIDPFPLLQPWAAIVFGVVVGLAGASLLFSLFRKLSQLCLCLAAIYIQNADALSAFALNIHYIVGFGILLFSPERKPRSDKAEPGEKRILDSAWPIRTLQATFLIQLFTAGICKWQMGDWVTHSDVLWTHVQGPYRNHLASWLLQIVPMWMWTIMQWGAFLYELVGPLFFLFRRTRWLGIVGAVGFVTFIGTTMSDLQYFAMQLATYVVLFLPVSVLKLEFLRKKC